MASWAFEMEALILGWYILVETGSVLALTLYGSLQFLGTLIAPYLGVLGDRFGRRALMCTLRAILVCLALILMTLGLTDTLTASLAFSVAFFTGLVRPSDLVMRNSLIADTMPGRGLANALGLSRTTMDSARIAGALAGAGLFSFLGIGRAYMFVAAFYLGSLLLTLGVSKVNPRTPHNASASAQESRQEPTKWQEFKDGINYVRQSPTLVAIMWLAFLVNLTAFPVSHGLMPYVAREVYAIDENGLGQLVAGFASGALTGSIFMAWWGARGRSVRIMVVNVLLWYAFLAIFIQFDTKIPGFVTLVFMGIAHSIAMISMSVVMLGVVSDQFRGRVMGVRMLAVYGLPVGLTLSGALVEWIGFRSTASIYISVGIMLTLFITYRWRSVIWR